MVQGQKCGDQLRDCWNSSLVIEDGALDQSTSSEGGEMWSGSGSVSHIHPTICSDKLDGG